MRVKALSVICILQQTTSEVAFSNNATFLVIHERSLILMKADCLAEWICDCINIVVCSNLYFDNHCRGHSYIQVIVCMLAIASYTLVCVLIDQLKHGVIECHRVEL